MASKSSERRWHEYFFAIIDVIRTKSKDPNTQFGCIVVSKDHDTLSTGYNSFPRGINDNIPARKIRPEKYLYFEHSERNAIYGAARNGTSLLGSTLYTQGVPCTDCSRAIIQSGIKRVYYSKKFWRDFSAKQDKTKNNSWFFNTKKSLEMLKEAGVKIIGLEI